VLRGSTADHGPMPTETDAIQLELVAGRAQDRPVEEA
jgi:hypothetical protein